jgi:hypothetical protein
VSAADGAAAQNPTTTTAVTVTINIHFIFILVSSLPAGAPAGCCTSPAPGALPDACRAVAWELWLGP